MGLIDSADAVSHGFDPSALIGVHRRRFCSPQKTKNPAAAGLIAMRNVLLLRAELLVTAAAVLGDRAERTLDGLEIAGLRCRHQGSGVFRELVERRLGLRRLRPDFRLGPRFPLVRPGLE